MSTSRDIENCGCSRTLRVMASPMARRIRERASLFSPGGATGEDEDEADSTSSIVTRPPGPVPLIFERSTPSSCARLRAAGLERIRSESIEDEGDGSAAEGPRALGLRPEDGG